jgi:hypothetical protein
VTISANGARVNSFKKRKKKREKIKKFKKREKKKTEIQNS